MISNRLNVRLFSFLLVLLAVGAFLPSFSAGFIWDDDVLLTANPQMRSLHGLIEIWTGKNSRDFTPLTLTSFWLEWRIWGDTPTGYHVVNVLLHALATVLLWRILTLLRVPGAWLAAVLFAIHPVNVASVAWVAERKNTLSAVLFFASVFGFLRFQKERNWIWYLVSIALFLLAGLSKGAVVTLPVVLLGCILWTNRKPSFRQMLALVPFVFVALGVAVITIRYQTRALDYHLVPEGVSYRIARAAMAIWWYLGTIVFPVGLSPMAPQWNLNLHSPLTFLPAFAAAAMGGLFFWKRHSWGKALFIAYGYYLWMLLPVLGFVWMALMQETPCADWWQYIATPGVFACAGVGWAAALKSMPTRMRIVSGASLCVVVALLFIQTWRRTQIYESMETYCRAVLAENPHAWSLQNNLGITLKQKGESGPAMICYRTALKDNPRFVEAHNNLANALASSGDLPHAETEFGAALALRPNDPGILQNLAEVYFREGKVREAFIVQADAIKADRFNAEHYDKFGMMLAANKQTAQAVTCFENGLTLDPDNIAIQIHLTQALLAGGRHEEAATACGKALITAKNSGDKQLIHVMETLLNQCRNP